MAINLTKNYLYMVLRNIIYITLLGIVFLSLGCDEEIEPPRDRSDDAQLFPLAIQQPAYYRLDSIILYRTITGIHYDTISLDIRETLLDSFFDPNGMVWYRGERWERPVGHSEWRFGHGYTVARTAAAAFRRQNNLKFTSLVFPVRENNTWNGHRAFDERRSFIVGGEFLDIYAGWNYSYQSVDSELSLDTGASYQEVVTVEQADVDNLIDLRRAYERYAPGVGLVEKFMDVRHTQCQNCCQGNSSLCVDLPWNDKAEKGVIVHQRRLP